MCALLCTGIQDAHIWKPEGNIRNSPLLIPALFPYNWVFSFSLKLALAFPPPILGSQACVGPGLIFMWTLEIQNQACMLIQQVLLDLEPSGSPLTIAFLVFRMEAAYSELFTATGQC